MSVELDGQTVLRGHTGDDGSPPPSVVWRYLKDKPLHPVADFIIPALPDRPQEAVLRGQLRVKVRYGAEVAASELRLIRPSPQNPEWLIDPDWIEANSPPGPATSPPRGSSLDALYMALVSGAVVACVLSPILSLLALLAAFASSWRLARWLAVLGLAGSGAGLMWGLLGGHLVFLGFNLATIGPGAGLPIGIAALAVTSKRATA